MLVFTLIIYFVSNTYKGFVWGEVPLYQLAKPEDKSSKMFEVTKKLIEELVESMKKNGEKDIETSKLYSTKIKYQSDVFKKRLYDKVSKMKDRVAEVIKEMTERFQASDDTVNRCINVNIQRNRAETVLIEAVDEIVKCADKKVDTLYNYLERVAFQALTAVNESDTSLTKVWKCTEGSKSNLEVGTCLGTVAVQAELESEQFLQSRGVQLARINLILAAFAIDLDLCAGTRLKGASESTSDIAIEITECIAKVSDKSNS